MCLQYKSFESTVGKGEIAHNEQFLLFTQLSQKTFGKFLPFSSNSKLSFANPFILREFKICHLEKG